MDDNTPQTSPAASINRPTKSPRTWPAVAIMAVFWIVVTAVGMLTENQLVVFLTKLNAPMVAGLLFLIWWWAFSRFAMQEKAIEFATFSAIGVATFFLVDKSMRMGLLMTALPVALTVWAAWLVVSRVLSLSASAQRVGMVATMILAWGYYTLLRMDGVTGAMEATISWRWTPTKEQEFLAAHAKSPANSERPTSETTAESAASEPLAMSEGDWPEFRGSNRDGQLAGVRIATDWSASPPKKLWRQKIGPGWSSFAVIGDRIFTQEQRGDDEVVTCYNANTGAELWAHTDKARFEEVVAGPGPRATPTFFDSKLYTLGASGKLNCLDPLTGAAHWTADIVADSGAKVPMWGFSSSPLIVDGRAIVFAGGPEGKAVLAYTIDDGKLAWAAGNGKHSYSSAQLMRIDDQSQVLLLSDMGLDAYDPATGKVLWQHEWPMEGNFRVVQPHLLGKNQVIVGSGTGTGSRLLTVSHQDGAWKTDEGWTSQDLKPYFNDFVNYDGHAYGFDGQLLCCIDLETGKRKWKKGRYGSGQVLLLADQGLLVVLGEKGEAVLVKAKPDGLEEIAQFQAIEGKTWNHPVIAHGKLFVRNGEEAACYELKLTP